MDLMEIFPHICDPIPPVWEFWSSSNWTSCTIKIYEYWDDLVCFVFLLRTISQSPFLIFKTIYTFKSKLIWTPIFTFPFNTDLIFSRTSYLPQYPVAIGRSRIECRDWKWKKILKITTWANQIWKSPRQWLKRWTNATNAIMRPPTKAIWGFIWKDTVEKSQTNAACVILHPLRQAIWRHIW